MTGGVPTVERLGSMTPEDLEAIQIDAADIESIQTAVNNYYGQFEESVAGETAAPEAPGSEPETQAEAPVETAAEGKAEPENESDTIENTEQAEPSGAA
jgi:hypothetical protein